ncbi:hypothetical protein MUK42_37297 [Musa troglodytarum]|uniref:Uncharacterized protein n=1 Tax=Musa troglodytarum TaxID=320322 RepID=A0A9E7H1N7_9LILI|nr:hypothetical protein MUK42_37297 [Musa troglodytarum]
MMLILTTMVFTTLLSGFGCSDNKDITCPQVICSFPLRKQYLYVLSIKYDPFFFNLIIDEKLMLEVLKPFASKLC